jgi:hypothetical protein
MKIATRRPRAGSVMAKLLQPLADSDVADHQGKQGDTDDEIDDVKHDVAPLFRRELSGLRCKVSIGKVREHDKGIVKRLDPRAFERGVWRRNR